MSALAEQFEGQAVSIGAEVPIDVSGTATSPQTRRADACLTFETRNPYFGRGLIIEVQYRNQKKDIEGTTHDYLAQDLSVAWLDTSAFEDTVLPYERVDACFRRETKPGYSVREYDYWDFEPRVEERLDWEPPRSRSCSAVEIHGSHDWREVPALAHPAGYSYDYCRCGLRRTYDDNLTRFVYDTKGILAPEIPIEEIKDAILPHPEAGGTFQDWMELDWTVPEYEYALTREPEVAPCRGPRGVHEWDTVEVVSTYYDSDRPKTTLYACRYCPCHVLTGSQSTPDPILLGDAPLPSWALAQLRKNPWRCTERSHYESDSWDYCPRCMVVFPSKEGD